MASMGVSFVVPKVTLMASFCTLSSFSRSHRDRVVRPRRVNEAEYHTLTQQEQITLFDAFWSHGFQRGQSVFCCFLLVFFCFVFFVFFVCLVLFWFFFCTWVLLIRPASCTPAFCRSGSRGILDCLCVLWLLHWRRLLALLVLLL